MQTPPYRPKCCRHGTDLASATMAVRLTHGVHCVHVFAHLAYTTQQVMLRFGPFRPFSAPALSRFADPAVRLFSSASRFPFCRFGQRVASGTPLSASRAALITNEIGIPDPN